MKLNKIALGFTTLALAIPILAAGVNSGLSVGEMVTPFHPNHVVGPDKGTDTCPPCKYGARPAVQVWVNGDNMSEVEAIAKALNKAVISNKDKSLKGFVIVVTDQAKSASVAKELVAIGEKNKISDIGMAWLPKGNEAIGAYKYNVSADVKNTVFVYENKKVAAKIVNLKADAKGLGELSKAISQIVAE